MSKKEEKKIYSNLEKEKERELYNRIRLANKRDKNEIDMTFIVDLLSGKFATKQDRQECDKLDHYLRVSYIRKHNLTNKQALALMDEQSRKEQANHPIDKIIDDCLNNSNNTVIKYEYMYNCFVLETNLKLTCMAYGCYNKTSTIIYILKWERKPLCAAHWEELKSILKEKPEDYWLT